jgi:hypothetical protein
MINVKIWYCIWHLSTNKIILPKLYHQLTGLSTDTAWLMQQLCSGRSSPKLNIAQVRIQCTYGQLHMYTQGSPAEIENPTHCNLTGCGTTTPLPVLSPSSSLPPPLSHHAFISERKNLVHVSHVFISNFSLFKTCITLKLHKFESVCVNFLGCHHLTNAQ